MRAEYRAGLYMRLSREDGERERRGESAGIESQRLLLRSYAEERGFSVMGEYVDDGYSGVSYDRPQFQRMLSDIEAGRINLVLIKDLSRLGRNYIASGELTEVYFPERRVRLIAVNDGYDSEREEDDLAPFRHVMNEMYARDISKKIRTALRAKMAEGQYIGSFAPYGYRKREEDRHTLEPDPPAAEVVVRIFHLAAEGQTSTRIAELLSDEGIPVPLDYRKICQGKPSEERRWSSSGVCKILRNPAYLGHTAQGRTAKVSLKSKKSFGRRREDWIVVENTHTALVSEEIFHAACRRGR